MIYVRSLNLAFLWIPKCGGRSLLRTLSGARIGARLQTARNSTRHGITVGRRNALIEQTPIPPDARLAVFVRDPIRRYQSMFSYHTLQRPDGHEDPFWSVENYFWRHMQVHDFNATMLALMEHEPALCTRTYEWYCGPEGAERVDYIGRLEHMEDHLDFILRECGYRKGRLSVPQLNRSKSRRLRWNADALAEMRRLEAPAIRRFYESDRVKFC